MTFSKLARALACQYKARKYEGAAQVAKLCVSAPTDHTELPISLNQRGNCKYGILSRLHIKVEHKQAIQEPSREC